MESELSTLGFPVIAISADRPAGLARSLEAHDLGYTLYSDSSLTAARAFGIVYQLDDAGVARFKGYGIDLEAASGESHHQLPVPSVFLVETGGTIRWVYSNADYRVRPDNATLLEAARGLTAPSPDPGARLPGPGHRPSRLAKARGAGAEDRQGDGRPPTSQKRREPR